MADFSLVDLLKLGAPLAGAAGAAAWAGVKTALNGTRAHIESVSKKVDERCGEIDECVQTLSGLVTDARIDIGRLETQIGGMKMTSRKRAK